jgi:hypothetical protein
MRQADDRNHDHDSKTKYCIHLEAERTDQGGYPPAKACLRKTLRHVPLAYRQRLKFEE